MAAYSAGVSTVLLPEDNLRNLEEIDPTVRKALNFITAQTADTVLNAALNPLCDSVPVMLTDIPGDIKTKSRKPGIRQ